VGPTARSSRALKFWAPAASKRKVIQIRFTSRLISELLKISSTSRLNLSTQLRVLSKRFNHGLHVTVCKVDNEGVHDSIICIRKGDFEARLESGEGLVVDVIVGLSCEIIELDISFRKLDKSDISDNFWVDEMTSIGIVRILNEKVFNYIQRASVHTSYRNGNNTVFVEVALICKKVVVLALFDRKSFPHKYGQEPISIFRDISKANTSRNNGRTSFTAKFSKQEAARANTGSGVRNPDKELAVARDSGELLIRDLHLGEH